MSTFGFPSAAGAGLINAQGSLPLVSSGPTAQVGTLSGSLYANVLALSPNSPGPPAAPYNQYAFIYPIGGGILFIEAPAPGNLADPGMIILKPGGDNVSAAADANQVIIQQPGAAAGIYGNAAGAIILYDVGGINRASVATCAGVPAIAGNLGDICISVGTAATEGIYECTTAGIAGAAVWTCIAGAGATTLCGALGVTAGAIIGGSLQVGTSLLCGTSILAGGYIDGESLYANVGAVSTVAAGANLGGSPPAPTITTPGGGGSTRGTINFGTGTVPAAGSILTVTFGVPMVNAPAVHLTPANAATALVTNQFYVVAGSVTTAGFSVGCAAGLAASQAAGYYALNFLAIG